MRSLVGWLRWNPHFRRLISLNLPGFVTQPPKYLRLVSIVSTKHSQVPYHVIAFKKRSWHNSKPKTYGSFQLLPSSKRSWLAGKLPRNRRYAPRRKLTLDTPSMAIFKKGSRYLLQNHPFWDIHVRVYIFQWLMFNCHSLGLRAPSSTTRYSDHPIEPETPLGQPVVVAVVLPHLVQQTQTNTTFGVYKVGPQTPDITWVKSLL